MSITPEEAIRRTDECEAVCKSFEYFIDEYVWIEDKENKTDMPFKMWPEQRRILPMILTSLLLIILKARQLGLTWMCAAYAVWRAISQPMELIVVISAKEDWAIEFLDRCKFILQRLPAWMIPPIVKDTSTQLRFQHRHKLFSDIKSLTTTEEGAQSKTPTVLILDETARNRHVKNIFASSLPGIEKAKGQVIIISNAHKTGVGWSWTRDMYINAMQGLNKFIRIFLPWWACPERPKNFKKLMLDSGVDEDDFSQNYPETEEEAVSALLGSYFGKSLSRHAKRIRPGTLGRLERDRDKDVVFIPDPKGIVEIWRYPYRLTKRGKNQKWRRRYAIGSDVSEGLGQTYSVAYVIDRKTAELVCRIRSNRVDAHSWADLLNMLSDYYDRALICVERTGAGQTSVKRLKDLNANQYRRRNIAQVDAAFTKDLGWNETNQAKHDLSEDLRDWFKNTPGGFWCPILLAECSTWILGENNKIGPEAGKLGDCVIAGGLTIQASEFLGGSPELVEPPVTGWLERWQNEKKGERSAWAM